MKAHYEIMHAKEYYGKHATGSVLLRNGVPEFHGSKKETEELLKNHKGKKIKCLAHK